MTFEEPLQATVSDGITRINVKFSAAASQRYAQKTKKSLTNGTPGGLIQLLDFEILATHLGPRPGRLTLFVNDFKSIGSNGSGHFGLATPHGIESRQVVKTHIERLTKWRNKESKGGHVSPNPSLRSQLSNGSSVEEPSSASQAAFSTQAPFFNTPATRLSQPDQPSNEFDEGLAHMRNNKFAEPTAKSDSGLSKNVNPVMSLSEPTHIVAAPDVSQGLAANGKKGLVNSSNALLGLLKQAKKIPSLKSISNGSAAPSINVPNAKNGSTADRAGARTDSIALPSEPSINLPFHPSADLAANETAIILSERTADSSSMKTVPGDQENQNPAGKEINIRDIRISKDQEALLDSDNCE